jgi:hypothetical protein
MESPWGYCDNSLDFNNAMTCAFSLFSTIQKLSNSRFVGWEIKLKVEIYMNPSPSK